MQVKGCYDASIPEIARLFTEGTNADMIPVKNWGAFAEKQGLAGAISLVDLNPIAQALKEAYLAMEQIKSQVYEITGISDIVRGASEASETATAQQIKGRYASLRLKCYQDEVALFATECLRLKAQIMCGKFDPQTLIQVAAVDQLLEEDKQFVPAALQLLIGERINNPDATLGHYDNPVRSFRVDIEADTLVQIDEEQEKSARMEFLQATGAFLKEAVPAAQMTPQLVPLLMAMLKFGVTGFKVGKTIEGAFDEAESQFKQAMANPQPEQPDPEMMKVQGQQQAEQARLQHDQQVVQMQSQQEQQRIQMESQARERELNLEAQKVQAQQQHAMQMDAAKRQHEGQMRQLELDAQHMFDKWKAELEASTKIVVAQIAADTQMQQAHIASVQQAEQTAADAVKEDTKPDVMKPMMDMHGEALAAITKVMEQLSKPKTVIRDAEGRVAGVQ